MPIKNLHSILRAVIFLGLLSAFIWILKPFFPAIILAMAFGMAFYQVSQWMRKKWHLNESLSAFLTVFLSVLCIILPLLFLTGLLAREALSFATSINIESLEATLENLNAQEQFTIANYSLDLTFIKDKIMASLGSIGTYVSVGSLSIISAIYNSLFQFFVFLLIYFYFLRDSKTLIKLLKKLLPYPVSQQKKLFHAFKSVTQTLVYGNLRLAAIAGVIAYIGFLIFGFKGAMIWALLAGVFSLIPALGTLLVYGLGILTLGFSEGIWLAALMFAYYILVEVVLRESLLQGWLLEDKLKLHPILVFFALVGGVSAFGSLGLIYGPLTIVFLGTLYQFHVKGKG